VPREQGESENLIDPSRSPIAPPAYRTTRGVGRVTRISNFTDRLLTDGFESPALHHEFSVREGNPGYPGVRLLVGLVDIPFARASGGLSQILVEGSVFQIVMSDQTGVTMMGAKNISRIKCRNSRRRSTIAVRGCVCWFKP